MKARPGLHTVAFRPELLRSKPEEWRSIVPIWGPLPDLKGVASIGDEYILSLGAHATHHFLLLEHSASVPLTFQRTMELVALLSFVIDDPVVPAYDSDFELGGFGNSSKAPDESAWRKPKTKVEELLETLRSLNDVLDGVYDPVVAPGAYDASYEIEFAVGAEWSRIELPTSRKVWRLLSVYWHGLLSPTPWGRILNFWRVFESSIQGKEKRERFYAALAGQPACQIPALWRWSKNPAFDKNASLRDAALRHQGDLRGKLKTDKEALRHLYENRRSFVAHAWNTASEYDHMLELDDLIADSQLVRYIARIALESIWS